MFLRDHHRCVVPGCRSSRNLDVHHLQFQVHGGGHALWNLALLCAGDHRLLHAGALVIAGRAPDQLTFGYPGREAAHVARATADERSSSSSMARPETSSQIAPRPHPVPADAIAALVGLGFKLSEARSALAAARAHVGHDPTLETWIREGLRACARAASTGAAGASRPRGRVMAPRPNPSASTTRSRRA